MIANFSLQSENYALSSGSGSTDRYTSATKTVDVRHSVSWSSVTLKCSGNRFVWVGLVTYGSTLGGFLGFHLGVQVSGVAVSGTDCEQKLFIRRDSTDLNFFDFRSRVTTSGPQVQTLGHVFHGSQIFVLDRPTAGNHTYDLEWLWSGSNSANMDFAYCKLMAKELLF